ncbi:MULTISPECIES: hypothetical protein [Microbacterium]|uniref:hypothetical protein n=1 Tax=Microbacterium TaxID=33882 RepID=UPI0028EBC1AE|nr:MULTISPECIES: hypothetical protein [Microbacterium]
MKITARAFAARFDVPIAEARTALRSRHGALPKGGKAWDLTAEEVLDLFDEVFAREVTRPLESEPTPALLTQYAQILAELRMRGVVRTGNAPLGDYAEHIAARVYGGVLEPNSAKSYDVLAGDRRIQVKARTRSASTSANAVFSVFRSFDFDVATLLVLDSRTYALQWAREIGPNEVRSASRWSAHVNGHLLSLRSAQTLGRDVTAEFTPYL